MGKKVGSPSTLPDGTIRISSQGAKFIKVNGKWEYIKIPKNQYKPQPKRISDAKIEEMRRLYKEGKSYDYISKILKCNKTTITKYCKSLKVYSPISIPSNMRETSYSGYYITEDGDAYRKPVKGERMPINENGLVYLKPSKRGHPKYPEKQYDCVNITIRDENGKFIKQFKKSNHQLVAETFCENPNNYTEILHIDENCKNNHYTNLKWGTHLENMKTVISPATITKSYKITDVQTGQVWTGNNMSNWIRENLDLIMSRKKSSSANVRDICRYMVRYRSTGKECWGLKIEK